MWRISVRDLQWRRRRFVIAGLAAAVVFAMALVLSGLSASFRNEARATVGAIGGDGWVMRSGVAGPITSVSSIDASLADALRRLPGVRRAEPVVVVRQAAVTETTHEVLLVGFASSLGAPPLADGRLARGDREVVADHALHVRTGDTVRFADRVLRVVGRTRGVTVLSGLPVVFVPLRTAQALAFEGRPAASAVLVEGVPASVPPTTTLLRPGDIRHDALSPMKEPIKAIDMLRFLLWAVAAIIVGSIVYLSALERARDFAVLKATGASSRDLLVGLALQAVLLSVAAAVAGVILARLLTPLFPLPVVLTPTSIALLPVVAVIVGLVASLGGARRALTADPVLAFGGV